MTFHKQSRGYNGNKNYERGEKTDAMIGSMPSADLCVKKFLIPFEEINKWRVCACMRAHVCMHVHACANVWKPCHATTAQSHF